MTVQELLELRSQVAQKMRKLHDTAKSEKRDLTADEQKDWDQFGTEIGVLDHRIEGQRAIDREAAAAVGDDYNEDTFRRQVEGAGGIERWRQHRGNGSRSLIDANGHPRALTRTESFAAAQRQAGWVRERSRDPWDSAPSDDDVTMGGFLRALAVGPQNESEERALGESVDSAGGHSVPDVLSGQWIDLIRRQSVAVRAGAITVPLDSDKHSFATLATDVTPAWRNEHAAIAEDDPTFGVHTFQPKSLAVLTKMSRELLEDSLNAREILTSSITSAMALELDRVAFFGSGTAPEPKGCVNATGIVSRTYDAGDELFENMSDLLADLRAENVEPTSLILHPREQNTLDKWADSNGRPIWDMSDGLKMAQKFVSNVIPSGASQKMLLGDFSGLAIGIRHQIQIEVLTERFADNLQLGFLAHLRADVVTWHPKKIGELDAITVA